MPAAPLSYPLGPVTTSGTTITLDVLVNQPTRITRDIARLADQKFFASRVFQNVGGVEGGAVLFELPPTTATDLFQETGLQEVAPGEEFPLTSFLRGVPVVAKPRKIGNKFYVTKEAVKRNDSRSLSRQMVQTANTIALTLDALAIAVLQAAISANTRTLAGQSWATAAGITNLNASGTNQATSDILIANKVLETEQRGRTLNSILINPVQELSLRQVAGRMGVTIDQYLASAGIDNWFSSVRVTAGTAILYDSTNPPGGWATEFPLTQETEWEGPASGGAQRWWYQWSVSPAMFVDDPFGLLQLTGIA